MVEYTVDWLKSAIAEEDIEVVGDAKVKVTSARGLDSVIPGAITFAVGRKNYKLLKEIDVAAAVVGKDAPADLGCTLLKVANPEVAFVRIANAMAPEVPHIKSGIDASAVIAESAALGAGCTVGANAVISAEAEIGENTRIYPGVFIGPKVKIGCDCIIYANVSIYYNVIIGNEVIIHSGAVIGADGFGFQWNGSEHLKIIHTGNVIIEDKVEIGANSTVDRGRFASTVIGCGCKLDNLVHIAHNCRIGAFSVFAAHVGVSGSVEIGKGVAVGGQVGFADHIKVGDGCSFYAKSGVASDVPAGQTMVGQPAVEYREKYKEYKNIRGIDKLKDRIKILEQKLEELINEADNA